MGDWCQSGGWGGMEEDAFWRVGQEQLTEMFAGVQLQMLDPRLALYEAPRFTSVLKLSKWGQGYANTCLLPPDSVSQASSFSCQHAVTQLLPMHSSREEPAASVPGLPRG